MSSDIDIEEHDVLQHPYIKEIFPDVSWIKTELFHVDDNETSLCENVGSSQMVLASQSKEDVPESNDASMSVKENTTLLENEYFKERNIKCEIEEDETPEAYSDSSNSNYNSVQYDSHRHSNKIILGSNIPNTVTSGLNVPENNILGTNFQNKIIVGSKPRLERDPLSAKVILKDWGYILKKHPYYCRECSILFPSQLSLDAHSASEHFLLVPKEDIKVEIIDNVSHKDYTEEMFLECPICGKLFKNHCFYLSHISNQHNSLDLPPISKDFSGNCLLYPVRPNLSSLHPHINKFQADARNGDSSVMEKPVAITIKSTARTNSISLQKTEKTSLSNSIKNSTAIGDDRVNISRKSTSKQNIAIKSTSKQAVPTKNVALKSTCKQITPSRNRAFKSTSKQEAPLRNVARKSCTKEDVQQSSLAPKSTDSVVEADNVSSKDRTKTSESFEDTSDLKYLLCPVCGICFRYLRNYINHCNANHKATYLPPKLQTFNGICECGYQNLIIKSFNAHVSKYHKPLATKIMTENQEYYCIECNISFATLTSYDIHNIVHKGDGDNVTDDKGNKNHSFEEFEVTQSSELLQSNERDEGKELILIAKETIFKCPACNLHFMSCKTAFFHSVQCISSKPKVTCDECDRSLRFQDIQSHKLQHQLMSTINVIEMTREAFYNLVLVCFECKVGVDAYSIHAAHATECPTKESTVCGICNVKIATSCLNRHAKTHANNITPLVIEYLCGTVDDLKELVGIERNVLYYCRVCKCYDPIKQADYHKYGNCIQSKMRICRICGLGFSYEFHAKHILEHQNKSFQLIDLKFIDIQTDEAIKPLIPDWNKCVIDYRDKFSGNKRRHECYKETTVYCNKCQENYNDLAYKIHLQYHEHSGPDINSEIMQKYLTMQSLWNIVYLCRNCNTTFDSYDLAVEHSQDHVALNVQNSSIMCTKCDLNFDAMSYARHANLHNGATINKESFCVLSFKSENLLTKTWDDALKVISCEQKSHILSKSVYNTHKEIRLELYFDGPSTHTLYKCAVCEAIVDDSRLLNHAYNKNACVYEKLFECSKCDLEFETKVYLNEHKLNHLPANEIRIILFNKPNHFSINEALIKQFRNFKTYDRCNIVNEESKLSEVIFYKCIVCKAGIQTLINIQRHKCSSLKYVQCTKCKLLYRPSILNAHMIVHEHTDKFYVAPFENGKLIVENRSRILYTLYKCKKCNICTNRKLPKHICVPKRAQSGCNSCGLQFMKAKYARHASMHTENPNLSRKHFNIIRYKPISGKADTVPITKKRSYKVMPTKHVSHKPMLNTEKTHFLYKCTCSLLFVTWRKLQLHLKSSKPNFIEAKCKCGLSFHKSSLKDHLTVHSNCRSIKNYLVASVNLDKGKIQENRKNWVCICTVCGTYYNSIKNLNCHLRGNTPGPIQYCRYCSIKISAESFDDHMELHKENNYGPIQLHKLFLSMLDVVPLKNRRRQTKKSKPKLYKCQDCDVHFTNHVQLKSHLSENNHDVQRAQCKFCNYFFLPTIIHSHKNNHHYRNKYKREDFIIINTDENIVTEKPANPMTITVDPSSLQTLMTFKLPQNIKKTIEKSLSETSEADLKKIFQCGICNLNFMVLKTLKSHFIRHSEKEKRSWPKYNCSFCGLQFQTRSLARHVLVHHKMLKLQLQDLIIKIYSDINKYTIKRIKPITQTNKRAIQSDKVKPAKKHKSTLKVNPGSFKSSKKSLVSKPHFETPQTSPKIQPNSKTNCTPIPTASSVLQPESRPQLFKCAYCDVYFTNYVLCYDHTLNHRPLDPTEYIGCKVCDLQLVCECLGIHMKGHREGTFNIDDLVVKEFQPRDGTPSIKTYLARNLIETNVISTFIDR